MRRTSWPHAIGGASIALALGLTTACGGTSGPGAAEGAIEVWALEDAAVNPIVQNGIDSYNESAEAPAELVTYVNDAYKQRLQVSLGSPNSPDIFFNWGGGNLAEYVNEGQVVMLSQTLDDNPEFRDAFLPSVLDVAQVDGEYYGVPMLGVLPVVLFYNRAVFEEAGLEPPRTYDDLLNAVDVFQEQDVTPITLPGAQGWTQLMWLSYLVDRVGGADTFQAIVDGEEGAWSDPAVIEALRMCQDLVERGAFGTNFASINYDDASASALLASGESAMFLMGSWDYSNQLANNPEFVEGGDLGFVPFPTLEGGEGEPTSIVGNPSNYFSVNQDSTDQDAAIDFLVETVTSDTYVDGLIDAGQVPAIEGIEDQLAETENAEFATFTYDLVAEAPTFTQSWDQALSPAASEEMLTALQLLFLGDTTPEGFVETMEGAQ